MDGRANWWIEMWLRLCFFSFSLSLSIFLSIYLKRAILRDFFKNWKLTALKWTKFCFDFRMCFAPQRRTLFQHLNFQKCSERGVFSFFTFNCASRHNGVQFFIAYPSRCLRAYFSTLRSLKAFEKYSVSQFLYLFVRFDFGSFDSSSSLPHCCCIRPQVRNMTSKLPPVIWRILHVCMYEMYECMCILLRAVLLFYFSPLWTRSCTTMVWWIRLGGCHFRTSRSTVLKLHLGSVVISNHIILIIVISTNKPTNQSF